MYIHKIVYSMGIAWTCFSCHLSKDNINVKIVTILMMLGLDMD